MNFSFRALAAVLFCIAAVPAFAADLIVTNGADSGPGSFREAIVTASGSSQADLITFALPGSGPHVISLTAALPRLEGPVSIINDRAGDKAVTIQRSAAAGTPLFRILEVGPGASVVITGLTISNGATTGPAPGGGIFNNSGYLTMRRCTVTGNSTVNGGGGIASYSSGTLDLLDCSITNNVSSGFNGGGIDAHNWGRTALTNCTVSNNSAPNAGGLNNAGGSMQDGRFPDGNGELRITNCTFSGNAARDWGGAIYNWIGNPELVSIVNSTITGNVARYDGGGVIAYNGDTGPYMRFGNTIIAGNTCTSGDESTGYDLARGVYVTDGHNIVGRAPKKVQGIETTTGLSHGVKGDQVGTPAAPIDPKLGALQMNGGSTATHALLAGSPAINNGSDALAPPFDQRRYTRSGVSDVGSFELGGSPGPTPPPVPTRFANLSTRIRVEAGDNALIGGFIVSGSMKKKIIVRAIGPSLAMEDRLWNPVLELYNQSGVMIASNDDWQHAPNRQEIINSRVAPSHNLESAILRDMDLGGYTAVVSDADGGAGVGMVELYDVGDVQDSQMANISTRGHVDIGNDVMIGGVILSGYSPQKVLIRAIAPSLAMPAKLLDPALELYDQNGTLVQSNDNWRTDQETEIIATTIPPPHAAESAIVRTLTPAPYTAVVRGVNGTTGIALVEVYALQ